MRIHDRDHSRESFADRSPHPGPVLGAVLQGRLRLAGKPDQAVQLASGSHGRRLHFLQRVL